jgi:16S rRNA (guanine(527)-N(7))-methyltransferase RsmG
MSRFLAAIVFVYFVVLKNGAPSPRVGGCVDSAGALRELVERFGLDGNSEEFRRLLSYLRLLEKWNTRINLTASTAWPAIGPLFEEALWAARYFPEKGGHHLDIGSGAGFPAIPMHIMRAATRLELLESRTKKAVFLEAAVAELQLAATGVVCERAEVYLRSRVISEFDVVSWKGIKLSSEAFGLLLGASRQDTRFWLFHGTGLSVADPDQVARRLVPLQREHFPGHTGWQLSIYVKRR